MTSTDIYAQSIKCAILQQFCDRNAKLSDNNITCTHICFVNSSNICLEESSIHQSNHLKDTKYTVFIFKFTLIVNLSYT